MMSRRKSYARRQGEELGEVIGELLIIIWMLVTAPVKWAWRKIRSKRG